MLYYVETAGLTDKKKAEEICKLINKKFCYAEIKEE